MSIVWRECERGTGCALPSQGVPTHAGDARTSPERILTPPVISTGVAHAERSHERCNGVEKSQRGRVVSWRFLDFTPYTMSRYWHGPFRSK